MNSALSNPSETTEKVQQLEQTERSLQATNESLEQQLDWFKRQLFGRKSEQREPNSHPNPNPNPHQPVLNGFDSSSPAADTPTPSESITYTRKKQRSADCVNDAGLRFDANVPVKTIHRSVPQLQGDSAGDYEVVREEGTYRLAQRTSSTVVLECVTPVIKHRATDTLVSALAPASLWPGTLADVSLVTGLIVDKLLYHQPLYRQHQRLGREGIVRSRMTLTNLLQGAAQLLAPSANAQLQSILQSKLLAIDESVPRRLETIYG